MSEGCRIRRATAEDTPFLAWAMTEAERGADTEGEWDWVLPGEEGERLALLARLAGTGPVHFCHWSRFLVAECEGTPAGAVSGYVPGRHRAGFEEAWHAVFAERGASRAESEAGLARFAPYDPVRVAIPADAWRVEWVATRPEHRRRGVIAALLEALLDRARREGHATAYVTAALENTPARRAYERAGFRAFAEWRHEDYHALTGSAGNVFLRRPL